MPQSMGVWRLSRDPFLRTWELAEGSDIRLTRIRPYQGSPSVAFTFRLVDEGGKRHCLMLRARVTDLSDA
jgi:hypothetical protein